MTLPNTVKEYSEYAAREFLQTVVFIDDRIFAPQSGSVSEAKKVASPKARKKVSKNTSAQSKFTGAEGAGVEAEEFSPHDIVASFAKKQIICSLYQPNEKAKVSPTSDIFPLCLATDIVIVDWDLYGDSGQRALELIGELIQRAVKDVPQQLRLILVYTQEPNLSDIAERLYGKVTQGIDDGPEWAQGENMLAFHTANSRVSVLGKKTARERPGVSKDHVVGEKDLADIAVKEFSKLANGLLHAATLLCLAEINKNSRKILSKFGAELDPAFLTHRAMCLPGEDATSHIVPLLISEIEAVLEDVLPPLVSDSLLRNWCQKEWLPGDHVEKPPGNGTQKMREIAEAICLDGFDAARKQSKQVPNLNNISNTRKASKFLLPAEGDKANHRFSRLMASRTFYHQKRKPLRLGSVLFRKHDKTYLLCIQPVCDSVRLKKDTSFVFVELIVTEPGEDNSPASHIVVREHNKFVELYYQPKSYRCFVATFAPFKNQILTEEPAKEKSPFFDDTSGTRYLWVDQLKITHAQRAVEDLARELSRVGLTESEWLRRLGRK